MLTSPSTPPRPPTKIGALLFPGFQLLDLTGPLDVLNTLSCTHPLTLALLSTTLAPVSTSPPHLPTSSPHFSQSILPTHTFATAPPDLDVLLVPGGFGSRAEDNIEGVVEFVRGYWAKGGVRWLLTVCTGSAVVAKAGVLEGRRATSNKKAFAWVKEQNDKVEWVAKARWVVDGRIWTSSGVAAGIDMIYAWVGEIWGEETASELADSSEYERNRDAAGDRFAERWSVV